MQQATLLDPASPSVSLVNDRPATTSLEVAKFFGKRHDVVLRDVRGVFDATPDNFRLHNFVESSYTNEQGKEQPMFILFRDGFMLLVMGYTGKQAMQIKIAYIEAFNAMEAQLSTKPAIPSTLTPSTPADRKPLRSLVNSWARLSGAHQQDLWSQVRANFQLERIDHLPIEWIPDAIAFVQAKIDALATIEAKPEPAALPPCESLAPAALKPAQMRRLAEKLAALEDLDNRFSQFRANTHENMYLMAREYIQLSEGVFYQLLGFNNSNTLSETQYLANPLIGQSYDAQTWVDSGMQRMSAAIRAARSATRVMMGA